MKLKSLFYYPIKACAGIELSSALISERGIENDRVFMVVDNNNIFMSQRDHHKMALIKPHISNGILKLSAPDIPDLSINFSDMGFAEEVIVWNERCVAINQGNQAAEWLSSYLGLACKLVMMEKSFQRRLDSDYALSESNKTGFADGYPFLIISQESLDDLNSRMEIKIPMNRFRPNIVVEGCEPYDEDNWQRIRIGDMIFEVVKPCIRCVVTTIDQANLNTSKEPLATLATYRVSPIGGVAFGQNLIQHNTGFIAVGDNIDILESK